MLTEPPTGCKFYMHLLDYQGVGTKVYFFKGHRYIRYDRIDNGIDTGFPIDIENPAIPNQGWPGFRAATPDGRFATKIDAAINNLGDGSVYFFSGDQYLEYDIKDDRVVAARPIDPQIPGRGWPGFKNLGFDRSPTGPTDLYLGDIRTDPFPWDPKIEIWLPGEPKPNMKAPFSSPTDSRQFTGRPWRGVLHTTGMNGTPLQEPSMEGAISEFRVKNRWPHFTVDRRTGIINQHIPINIGARSVRNLTDNNNNVVQSFNADNCVQIEIVGNAINSNTWSSDELNVIKGLMNEIMNRVPIPRQSDRTFLAADQVAANPGNRMSVDEWNEFSGWCGHQHVPSPNDHRDPGAIDISFLLSP